MNKQNIKIVGVVIPVLIIAILLFTLLKTDDIDKGGIIPNDTPVENTEKISEVEKLNSTMINISTTSNKEIQASLESIKNGDFDKSIEKLEETLKKSSGNEKLGITVLLAHSYLDYGTVSYNEIEYALKARELIESSEIPKNSWYYNYYMGYSYEIEREYPKALILYTEALGKAFDDQSKAKTYTQIGHIYDLDGDLDEAYKNYEKALQLAGYDVQANINMARILARKGEQKKAITYFEKALSNTEDKYMKAELNYSLSTMTMYGEGYSLENMQKSADYAQAAIDANDKYPLGYVGVARVLITTKNNIEEAEKLLESALEIYSKLSLAYEWFGIMEQGKGNFDKSIELFTKAIENVNEDITLMKGEIDTDKSRLYYLIAVSYSFAKDEAKALENLKIAFDYPNLLTLTLFKSEIDKENYGVFSTLKGNEEFENLTKGKKK